MGLLTFTGFETGGLEEAKATTGSPSVQTANPRTGTYSLLLAGAVTPAVYDLDVLSIGGDPLLDDVIIGFGFRTNVVIPTNDTDFFIAINSLDGQNIRLRLKAITGDVDIIDANNAVAGTITAPFAANTQYFIEVYFEQLDSGNAEVFINDVSKISLSGKDFLNGTRKSSYLRFTGDNVATQDIYIDDVYVLSFETAASARYTSSFNIPRAYQDTNGGAAEGGAALNVGTWANASETPVNETNVATYSASNVFGFTTTDSPSTRLGPTGGPTLGTIKGAKWVHRLKRATGAGTTHFKRYGNSGDGISETIVTLTTSYVNYITVSESATEVPLATESFQYGMGTGGAQDISAAEIWAFIANVAAPEVTDHPVPPTVVRQAVQRAAVW